MDIIQKLYIDKLIPQNFTIICNGFKKGYYFNKIIELKKLGLNIIPVIESIDEARMFIDQDTPLEVGMRINIDEQMAKDAMEENRSGARIDTRFGIYFEDMVKFAEEINNSKHLKFKLLHYHIGGTIKDIDKYINFFKHVCENYYSKLKAFSKDLEYLDIGGGFPTQYNLEFNFNYEALIQKIILNAKKISEDNGMPHPHIIGEHGRYTVSDHSFFYTVLI